MTGLIGKNYSVYFDTDAVSLSVSGGSFGEITLFPAPLFHLRLKRIADGTDINITSADTWRAGPRARSPFRILRASPSTTRYSSGTRMWSPA